MGAAKKQKLQWEKSVPCRASSVHSARFFRTVKCVVLGALRSILPETGVVPSRGICETRRKAGFGFLAVVHLHLPTAGVSCLVKTANYPS